MRLLLILVCLAALAATGWFTIERGTDNAFLRGAPQVQEIVSAEVAQAIDADQLPDITVATSGRDVTLTGTVVGSDERDRIVTAAREVKLVRTVNDRLSVVQNVSPFSFSASKSVSGAIELTGFVPTLAAEETILAAGRTAASGSAVKANLELAAGAPGQNWTALAAAGVMALSHLTQGTFTLNDRDAVLSGSATGEEAGKAALAAVAGTNATWTFDISGVAPVADPYTLTVLKTPDGAVIIGGNMPDEATGDQLRQAAQEISSQVVGGTLELAEGMPDDDWPDLVKRGIAALGATDNGLLTVSNNAVDLTAEVQTNADLAALRPLIDDGWMTQITVLNPPPTPSVTIALAPDGSMKAAGLLPTGLTEGAFEAALPGITLEPATADEPPAEVDWAPALSALNTALPRFRSATAKIDGTSLTLEGFLVRGFSLTGTEATLRTALPPNWTLITDIGESAPLPEVILSLRDGETVLSGVLPAGLSPDAALRPFGDSAGGEGLTTGGEGAPEAWEATMAGLSSAISLFSGATGKVTEGALEIDGTLRPGYTLADVQSWLEARVPEGWTVGLVAEETPASEGDSRTSLATGEPEIFRSGYWLPDLTFPVSQARCKVEVGTALQDGKITFVTASARINEKGRALLNRLAAVAVRCLNSSVLRLEIGGHTDSVGNDERNMRLSQERAQAVLDALLERGVREDAMKAIGYGETEPIASNDVPSGRAQNRRISFDWISEQN